MAATTTLADQLTQLREQTEGTPGHPGKVPAASLEVMHRVTEQTRALVPGIVKAGDANPTFDLEDQDGQIVRSADLLQSGPVVVVFFRGIWCSYCTKDLEALQSVEAEIARHGAKLVALTPELPKYSKDMKRKLNLTFPILFDKDNEVARRFGLAWTVPPELKELYVGMGLDLERFNGNSRWELPIPGRFLLGQQGVIVYANADPDYTRRPEPEEVLGPLEALKA
ncbi:MAG: peroxiredoxin-like family protein [Acidobacteriaceae bacterium]